MNLLLIDAAEIDAAGRVRLDGRRALHLLSVLRVVPGQRLRLGVIGGAVGEGQVTAVGEDTVDVAVEMAPEITPEIVPEIVPAAAAVLSPMARPPVELVVALPRPQALKRVLQYSAAMGVERIDLVAAWRVEKSFFQTPLLQPAALDHELRLGAEQGAFARLPEVRIHRRLVPFLEELAAAGDGPLALLAHPAAAAPFEVAADHRVAGPVRIAIGPEGGWIDREVATFTAAGFRPARLGPWILRVETALVAVLAQLELRRRQVAGSVLD